MVLNKTELAVLGFILAVVQVLQQIILDIPQEVHTGILILVTVLAALGATTAGASALGSLIPHQVALFLSLLAGVLQVVNIQISMSNLAHGIIAGVITLVVALGVKPQLVIAPGSSDLVGTRRA